jgi:4-hydroxy-tetrahydrodipicolinate reductase
MARVAIIGVTGRMGKALVRASREMQDIRIAAGVTLPNSPDIGRDIGEIAGEQPLGVRATSDLPAALAQCDVAIDFSWPDATSANLAAARAARKPLLICTTGFPQSVLAEVEEASRDIAVLVSPNTSLGVTLLIELVRMSAAALPTGFDIEIVEAHHRHKQDAPSGTALALGRAAAEGRHQDFERVAVKDSRSGVRREGDIGFAVVRGGDIAGDHTVIFAGAGEQLALSHRATDRAIFARGALRAAAWLASKPAGRYAMRDVLGVKTVT